MTQKINLLNQINVSHNKNHPSLNNDGKTTNKCQQKITERKKTKKKRKNDTRKNYFTKKSLSYKIT